MTADRTQSEARAAQDKEPKSPGKAEMEDLGKTSRSTEEIRQEVEQKRDHGHPKTTQQIPVTPAPISQEELEKIEEEKRQQNLKAQEPG